LFGEGDAASLADALHLPERTWRNYEAGVAIPAVVVLQFIEVCGVDPHWLLSGRGRKYSRPGLDESTATAAGAGSERSGAMPGEAVTMPGEVVTTGAPADARSDPPRRHQAAGGMGVGDD
jgi:hypothetical protein